MASYGNSFAFFFFFCFNVMRNLFPQILCLSSSSLANVREDSSKGELDRVRHAIWRQKRQVCAWQHYFREQSWVRGSAAGTPKSAVFWLVKQRSSDRHGRFASNLFHSLRSPPVPAGFLLSVLENGSYVFLLNIGLPPYCSVTAQTPASFVRTLFGYEECRLLGCGAVRACYNPTFRRSMSPPCSGQKK
jgi:hypothetical protein